MNFNKMSSVMPIICFEDCVLNSTVVWNEDSLNDCKVKDNLIFVAITHKMIFKWTVNNKLVEMLNLFTIIS
jgi:hypothetical protein